MAAICDGLCYGLAENILMPCLREKRFPADRHVRRRR